MQIQDKDKIHFNQTSTETVFETDICKQKILEAELVHDYYKAYI